MCVKSQCYLTSAPISQGDPEKQIRCIQTYMNVLFFFPPYSLGGPTTPMHKERNILEFFTNKDFFFQQI